MSYSTLGLVCRAWRDAMRPNGPVIAIRNRLNLLEPWIVFVSVYQKVQFLLVDPAHRGCLEIVRPLPEPILSRCAPSPYFMYTDPMAAGSVILMHPPLYLVQGKWELFNPDTMYCFDVQNMEWTDPFSFLTLSPDKNCDSSVSSAALDGYLYVVGGYWEGISKKAARLDIASRTWEALPDLTEDRMWASVVVLQGCIYLVAGLCCSHSPCKVVFSGEIWDPNSRRWTLIPELWPANVFGNQSCRPCIAVVKDRLYALRVESLQELMYYDDTSKLWISMGKFCFSEMIENKYAFRVLQPDAFRMVGVTDKLFVFCNVEPLSGTELEDPSVDMVALYVTPAISEPLTWGMWPLCYPVDYKAQPLVLYV